MSSPAAIREALLDWLGPKRLTFKPGWDTRGRPWVGGIRGVIVHDLVGVDRGAVDWTYAAGELMPYVQSVVGRPESGPGMDGHVIINTALSCWGSGAGGPWPAANIRQDQAHLFIWQIEHATWGRVDDITDRQAESTARMICAIREVAGTSWPSRRPWSRVIRHASWTDGGPELGLTYWLPTRGRKVDTKRPLRDWRTEARARWDTGKA